MRKKEHFTADYTRHFVMEGISLIKGYKLTNETNETPNIIVNTIKIEINLSSDTGHAFYNEITLRIPITSMPKARKTIRKRSKSRSLRTETTRSMLKPKRSCFRKSTNIHN